MNISLYWLWTGYTLLFLASFGVYFTSFVWLWGLILVMGYGLRMLAKKQQAKYFIVHVSWQINTVWLVMLIWLLALIAVMFIGLWMDSESDAMARLDQMASSGLPPAEALWQFWSIPGVKSMVAVMVIAFVFSTIWPLKLTMHGMLALFQNKTPRDPHSGSGLAVGMATLISLAVTGLVLL